MTEPITIKKDENGNVIYKSWPPALICGGAEAWYDSNGNRIHSKSITSLGEVMDYWWNYDENSNLIYEKTYSGIEIWYENNSQGNPIHSWDSVGNEWWSEYDEDGNLIYDRDSDGFETYYHSNGSIAHDKFPDGSEYWYDPDGHKTQEKDVDGVYYHFDSKGNKIQLNQNTSHEHEQTNCNLR